MRYLFILLFSGVALAYNPYLDYMLCRFYQEESPMQAEGPCLRSLEKAPTPILYMDVIRLDMRLNKRERALKIAKEFKERYPKLPDPYLLLNNLYKLKKEEDKALQVLEEGHLKNPDSREIIILLVEDYFKKGEFTKARNVLQRLVDLAPENPLPYFLLARLSLLEGKQQEAIDYLEKSLRVKGTFEAGFITLGGIYEQRGEYSRAELLYKDILKQDPDNRSALDRLANLYLITNRYEEAKEVYRRLIELYPEAGYLYQYSLLLINAGEKEEAKELLEGLYKENPENPEIAFTYALLLENLGERERALEIYIDLQKRIGNNPRIIERLAGIYMDRGEYQKAEELLKIGLTLDPNSYQLNLLMGNLKSEREDYQEALRHINKAIEINSRDYRGYFLRAVVYDKKGEIVSAEENLRRALELSPEDKDLLNHLGYSLLLWYEGARVDEAEKLIQKALEKDPENPAYIDSMAWVLYHKGEYKGAYELLLKALEKEKEDPVIYEHLGDVLLRLGNVQKAQEHYKKAYELLLSGKRGEPNQKERLENKLKAK
ncbi:MAG: tetratricopeptide repeat protein [Aquificaceae bacterium]